MILANSVVEPRAVQCRITNRGFIPKEIQIEEKDTGPGGPWVITQSAETAKTRRRKESPCRRKRGSAVEHSRGTLGKMFLMTYKGLRESSRAQRGCFGRGIS